MWCLFVTDIRTAKLTGGLADFGHDLSRLGRVIHSGPREAHAPPIEGSMTESLRDVNDLNRTAFYILNRQRYKLIYY